jgi:hypothetical protein
MFFDSDDSIVWRVFDVLGQVILYGGPTLFLIVGQFI